MKNNATYANSRKAITAQEKEMFSKSMVVSLYSFSLAIVAAIIITLICLLPNIISVAAIERECAEKEEIYCQQEMDFAEETVEIYE